MASSHRPILVTGSHRSGTTWTGTMLGLSGQALPIHEPFNPGHARSWLPEPPPHWFEHITTETAGRRRTDFERVVALRPPVAAIARRKLDPRHLIRTAQEMGAAAMARRKGTRALVKDPIAFFSAPWIHATFDADVLVLVRHPGAFASSLKRMNWTFDFSNFVNQPSLMELLPAERASAVERAVTADLDIIDTAILLWNVINGVAVRYQTEQPSFLIRRYEDLAGDPVTNFATLYGELGLTWSDEVEASVRSLTSSANTSVVADGDKGGVARDSHAAMWTWLNRLSDDEVARVRTGTADVAANYYDDADWTPPH